MAVTVGIYNHTTALIAGQLVHLSNLRAMLLNASAAFNAAHTSKHSVDNGSAAAVTMTIAAPGVVTWAAHGMANGDRVQLFTTGALPTGLTAGQTYYVVNQAANTFQVSATAGGAAINTTGTQSGVHTAMKAGSYEVQGNGWTPGGPLLPNVAVTTVTTNDALIDADDISVTAAGGNIGPAYAVLIYDATTGKPLKYVDFGQAWTAGDTTDFKLRVLSGLFSLDYTAA